MTDLTLVKKPTTEVAPAIAALNRLCFGDDDIYNDPVRVQGCVMTCIWNGRTGELEAYALVKPGRVSTLERYGVHPQHSGKGNGVAVLKLAVQNHRAVSTYAASSNGASCAALIKVGFFITGTDNGFVSFMWLPDDAA